MNNSNKEADFPTQKVTSKSRWLKAKSHSELSPSSLSDKSEKELGSLLGELKVSLQIIAKAQQDVGSLSKAVGRLIKAARQARVKRNPSSRKVVLSVEEYERLKELSGSSSSDEETQKTVESKEKE